MRPPLKTSSAEHRMEVLLLSLLIAGILMLWAITPTSPVAEMEAQPRYSFMQTLFQKIVANKTWFLVALH